MVSGWQVEGGDGRFLEPREEPRRPENHHVAAAQRFRRILSANRLDE